MAKKNLLAVAVSVVFFSAGLSFAAEVEQDSTPRIGLVLSGGGALGSAHVGVLKVLEELRIPVDYVAGTSMGAIIGGLYAAGTSPAEMEQILAETDWRDLLDDRPPRRRIPLRQKQDDQTYLAKIEAGFNRGAFQMPSGLISGQKLGFTLQVLALQTAGIHDFDQLPIPFRAVATDLESGELVLLRRGNLAKAMRASMSVPGVFSPIKIEDRLLVDGGLVANLPADIARTMGADLIIAVDVGQPLAERGELASLGKVTSQMVSLQIRRNVEEQASRADILIKPLLEGFSSLEFERGSEMIPLGEAAARRLSGELERYSLSPRDYEARLLELRQKRSIADARIGSVQLSSSSTSDPRWVLEKIRVRQGDALDLGRIRSDIERLYETGDYERVDFYLEEVDGAYDLFIEAIDKPWGPNYLRFGLNLFANLEGESSFDVLASYTMTRLNRRRAELKVQTQVGENPILFGEFYQPLTGSQTWFTAATIRRTRVTELIPVGGGASAEYEIDQFAVGLNLGYQAGRFGEFRLGLTRGGSSSRLKSSVAREMPVDFPIESDLDIGGIRMTAVLDQFDNVNFPRHGYLVFADYFSAREELGSDSDYEHLVAFLGAAVSHGRHTLLSLCNLYSALDTDSPEIYNLGGLFRLSGAAPESISGQYGGSYSLLYLNKIADLQTGFGSGVYLGGSVEAGNLWAEQSQASLDDLRFAGSVFVGADTIFGPLYLAHGFSEGETSFYFFIGRTF